MLFEPVYNAAVDKMETGGGHVSEFCIDRIDVFLALKRHCACQIDNAHNELPFTAFQCQKLVGFSQQESLRIKSISGAYWAVYECRASKRKETMPVIFFFSILRPKKQKSDGSTCTLSPVLCRHVTTILTLKGSCFCTVVIAVGKSPCFAESARLVSTVEVTG